MVGCTFIAIGSERRKVGVSALITTWNEEEKFIVFPLFSLLFLSALSIRKLSLLLHRVVAQNAATQENSNNKQNNRSMGYLIITDQNWQKLRDEILSLADCCHKAFGEKCKHTDWLHMVMCASCLTSVSAPCSIIVTRVCCRLHKSGTSAITSVKTWSGCCRQNQRKPRTINKDGNSKRFEHGFGRDAGGAVRHKKCEQTDKGCSRDIQASLWR